MEKELRLIARPEYDPSEMDPLDLQEIIRNAEEYPETEYPAIPVRRGPGLD